jgi:hypothetical protein
VFVSSVFAGFGAVFVGVRRVAVRDLRVMAGFFVRASLMMLRRFAMMLRGMFVMLCGGLVVLGTFVIGHRSTP